MICPVDVVPGLPGFPAVPTVTTWVVVLVVPVESMTVNVALNVPGKFQSKHGRPGHLPKLDPSPKFQRYETMARFLKPG